MMNAYNENEITSRENPLIKQYIKLRDHKKHRSELKMFVLEGKRLVMDAVSEGAELELGFVTREAQKKYPDEVNLLRQALKKDLYLITDELGDVLSDTKGSQGIYCCARALDKIPAVDKINTGGKFLVLNSLQDPGNIGTIIRAADAVGINGVYLCSCCDIYNPKVVRSTMGSLFRVPFCDSAKYSSVIALLRASGIATYASVVDKDAQSVKDVTFDGGAAIVIGNEGRGLAREDADLCDKKITIKMNGNINSLNAASAASILLWEMTRREVR